MVQVTILLIIERDDLNGMDMSDASQAEVLAMVHKKIDALVKAIPSELVA